MSIIASRLSALPFLLGPATAGASWSWRARICLQPLGSCGQPSASSEAVGGAVTQGFPGAGSTGWRCLGGDWLPAPPTPPITPPRLLTEPRELMPAPQQSRFPPALPSWPRWDVIDHRCPLHMHRGSSRPDNPGPVITKSTSGSGLEAENVQRIRDC